MTSTTINHTPNTCKSCNPCTKETATSTHANTVLLLDSIVDNNNNGFKPISSSLQEEEEEEGLDAIDIFDVIRDVKDPEHPFTLEDLNIISEDSITVTHQRIWSKNGDGIVQACPSNHHVTKRYITITITPTVKHCSLVADISLCIRTRLLRVYGQEILNPYKIDIYVAQGSHENEQGVNRQINDKERVAAALENPLLMQLVEKCVV